jgi:Ca2+/H+ antiporter, TMEM165/GDT1 family
VLGRFLATFAVVFLAELPDKTMVATLVLTTTYRRAFWVWLGAAGAFLVHVTVAVLAGGLISRLPERPVKLAVAVLFTAGAVVLWRQRDDPAATDDLHLSNQHSPLRIAAVAFTTLLVAEIGDLTELTIASLAATSGEPIPVFFGGLLGLWTVAALAAAGGVALLARVPVRKVRTGASVLFALLAVVTLIEALA